MKDNKRKNFNGKNSKPQGKPKWDKTSFSSSQGKKPQDSENQQYGGAKKDQCKHCFKKGHHKRDCPDFLKSLLVGYLRTGYPERTIKRIAKVPSKNKARR